MNTIAVIILTAVFADFILHCTADVLNLKMLKNNIPEAFRGLYDLNNYNKCKKYLKVNTRFGWITSTFDLIIILIFWIGKFFPLLDQWARSWHKGPIITGLIYIGALALIKILLSIPFSIYSTFVIEENFGFNKTTWGTFLKDLIKGAILLIMIGTILLTGILAFFKYTGDNAWWYCWICVSLFTLAIQFIAPTWIMPLFNKFKPLEEGELKQSIFSYARSIDFQLKNIYVMDGSKRSSKSNAFFTGFGENKRIVLFDTLIKKHTAKELVAVLAHEMGHYKKKHIFQMTLINIMQIGIMFFLLSFFISSQALFDAFYMEQKSVYAGLIFFGMLYSPIEFFAGILMQLYSRKNEYEADKFAVKTTADPESMVNALKKLSVDNLSNITPHPFYVFLNYSHPPVLERIKAILSC